MNKIYKVIWSKARNCYVVVSELAKRNGKCSSSLNKKIIAAFLAAGMTIAASGSVEAERAVGVKPGTTGAVGNANGKNSVAVGDGATTPAASATTKPQAETMAYNFWAQIIKNDPAFANETAVQNATTYSALNSALSSVGGTTANKYRSQLTNTCDSFLYQGDYAIAVGYQAQAQAQNAIAVGAGGTGKTETISRDVKRPGTTTTIKTSTPAGAYGSYDIAIGKAAAHGERVSATTGAGTNNDTDIGGYYYNTGGEGGAIAVGKNTLAVRQHAIAVGTEALAAGQYAIAVGSNARALTPKSIAIGGGTAGSQGTQGRGAINTPLDSPDNGGHSITIGTANNFTYGYNITDDYYANTKNSIAIGYRAHTHAANAFAIGVSTDATAERSFAIGTTSTNIDEPHRGAHAGGQGSLAFGDQAVVGTILPVDQTEEQRRGSQTEVNDAISVGTNTITKARNAVALGGGMSYTYHAGAGTSKMTNETIYWKEGSGWVLEAEGTGANVGKEADGAIAIGGATGTVTGEQGKTYYPTGAPTGVDGYTAAATIGDNAKRAVAIGSGSVIGDGAENSVAVGARNNVTAKNATAVGQSNEVTAEKAIAIGASAKASKENALAVGANQEVAAKNAGAFGVGSYVFGESSYSVGNNNNVYAKNALAMGNNITIGAGADNSIALGEQSIIDNNITYGVALGAGSTASRKEGDTGYDYSTNKTSSATSTAWQATHAAVSVGDDANMTRQITGVAAGSKDTDAVNVAQLKKTVWNIGLAADGGKVKNPTDGYSLDVKTTVVGNGKNKVQFVAGKGITLTSVPYTTVSTKDTYGIAISTRFEALETTPDNVATAIYYDGIRYTIASGGSSAPSKVTTDHRALNVDTIHFQKLDDQGKPVVDEHGNPVMEDYRSINSPYIHINGLRADPSDPYTGVYVAPEYQANAAGENAIAIGREADALYTNSIAIGHLAEAGHSDKRAVNTVALGYRAHALANNSVSVGTAAFATGNRSIAIGVSNVVDTETLDHNDQRAWAAGQGSMVLGNEARAVTQAIRFNINNTGNAPIDYSTNDAIALGTRADARALNAIALGGNMSYTDSEGKVTYGSPEGNARDYGATVGEGAKSAIAIGGAYGSQKTDSTGAVTGIKSVTYAAATSYGAKGIAIGSGALIANNEDYLDLLRLIDNPDYQDLKKTYNNTRHAFTVAEREFNNYLASLNGVVPTSGDALEKYNRLKGTFESAQIDYNKARGAFLNDINEKIALEKKNASTVEDAIAIGAGSRTGIKGGIALGSQATAGYLDRSGTESALTGYDMRTETGYFGSESDDPTWKATHGALSIGALSTTDPSSRTDNVTRRITNVAAGVFDRDAVNVAQLKRATTFTSDNRNMAIGSDEQGHSKIQSPFAHFEGVAQMSEAISITEYTKNAYTAKVNTERANINTRISDFQKAIAELDRRLDGDGTTENIGLRAKLSLVPSSNTQLQKNYQQLIKDIEYEKELLSNKITALNKELTNLPSDAGSAYDAAVGLVAQQAHAYGTDSIAIGKGSVVGEADSTDKGKESVAIGVGNTVTGNNSIAIGSGLTVTGARSGAFGDPSVIDGDNSYSIGNNNMIKGAGSADEIKDVFVLGNNVTIDNKEASNSVFLGSNAAYVPADYTPTGGTTAGRSHYNSMIINDRTYDFAGGDRTAGVVSAGGGTVEGKVITRRIQNVAPGLISAESTDAINGSQLYAAMQALSIEVIGDTSDTKSTIVEPKASDSSGTSSSETDTGEEINIPPAITYEVKASTTKVNGSTNIDVVDINEVDPLDAAHNYDYKISLKEKLDLGENGSVTIGNTTLNSSGVTVVNADGSAGPKITQEGIDAAGKKITNVERGSDPNDAVNFSQLQEYAAGNNQAIANVDSRARKGIAGAAALAALHPMDFDPDDKLTFAAGMGHYRGETAAAIGAFYRADEKVMFSVGGTVGNGENMVNAGVSFSLDRTPRVTGSRTALTKEVVHLREQVARQDAQIAKQDQQIAMQGAQIAQLTALVSQLTGVPVAAPTVPQVAAPTPFPDNLDNKWAYDVIEDLEQRGYFTGYAGRELTRDEFAAALDRAMAGGAKLEERIIREFEPELSHVRVAHVEGKGNNEGEWYERPRASHDKYEDRHEIAKKPSRVQEKKVTSKS